MSTVRRRSNADGEGGRDRAEEEAEEDLVLSSIEHERDRLSSSSIPHCSACLTTDPHELDGRLKTHFDVAICYACKKKSTDYNLMTKSRAKSDEFMLTDRDLDDLSCLLSQNTKNPAWGDVKLYLEGQVREKSLQVFGSQGALDAERVRRQTQRVLYASKKSYGTVSAATKKRKLLSEDAVASFTKNHERSFELKEKDKAPLRDEIEALKKELGQFSSSSAASSSTNTIVRMKSKKAEISENKNKVASKPKKEPLLMGDRKLVHDHVFRDESEDDGVVTQKCILCGLERGVESL